jgi:glycosyl-4,4'-diaponeurosporenoate acyltransferase
MQILFLSKEVTLLLCCVIWPIIQISSAVICLKIPDEKFNPNSFFYGCHKWEKEGKLYAKIFKVNRWKKLLPDGRVILISKLSKHHSSGFSQGNLEKYLVESCRGELSHWISILPFWIFGFIAPGYVVFYMLLYALLVNLPCIIAQRYNRPRVLRIMNSFK